eukprot:131376-Chlamydomonas_euryale.AAC.1
MQTLTSMLTVLPIATHLTALPTAAVDLPTAAVDLPTPDVAAGGGRRRVSALQLLAERLVPLKPEARHRQ